MMNEFQKAKDLALTTAEALEELAEATLKAARVVRQSLQEMEQPGLFEDDCTQDA
jgi:predicted transcriptional regulator